MEFIKTVAAAAAAATQYVRTQKHTLVLSYGEKTTHKCHSGPTTHNK